MISRVCEEFGCLPSQAEAELMDDPNQLALSIMELRGYARAYQQLEQSREHDHVEEPTGPMAEKVHEINWELLKEDRRGRG